MKYVGISRTFSEIWEVWRFAECVAKFCELFLKFPKPNKWFSIKSIISIASWMKVQGSSCSAGGDLEWDPRVERGERQSALRCRLLRGLERMTPATAVLDPLPPDPEKQWSKKEREASCSAWTHKHRVTQTQILQSGLSTRGVNGWGFAIGWLRWFVKHSREYLRS